MSCSICGKHHPWHHATGLEADCGLTFQHDPHAYLLHSGLAAACDGSTTKRPSAPGEAVTEAQGGAE